MKKLLSLFLPLLMTLCGLTACEEYLDETPESADWAERNAAYFHERMTEAKAAIAAARAAHGDAWPEHCSWRVMRTYAITAEAFATETDSICVQILRRGTGTGSPIYTDSIRVNYLGRLIPDIYSTDEVSRTKGYVFDHTGLRADSLSVFSPELAVPAMFRVSNTVEGFTTAVQHMVKGDLWRIYVPYQMGYGQQGLSGVRPTSTLVFDLELRDFFHAGLKPSQE